MIEGPVGFKPGVGCLGTIVGIAAIGVIGASFTSPAERPLALLGIGLGCIAAVIMLVALPRVVRRAMIVLVLLGGPVLFIAVRVTVK